MIKSQTCKEANAKTLQAEIYNRSQREYIAMLTTAIAMKPLIFVSFILSVMVSKSFGEVDEFLTFPTNIETVKKHLKTERPMIGILSLYMSGRKIIEQHPSVENCSYIAASLVRFIEGAGARAVPIPENLSDKKVDKILKGINGVIIPGGDVEILDVGYERISKRILEYSIAQKKKGIIWPVLGEFLHPN